MLPESQTRRKINSNRNNYDYLILRESGYRINNNNKTIPKFTVTAPLLLSQTSLLLEDSEWTHPCQSLLAPPSSLYPIERRFSLSLPCDSSPLHSSRRRLRRNSAPRLSDLEEDKNHVTLLTFAKMVQTLYKKFGNGVRRTVKTLFVARPKKINIVCEAVVLQQANWICTDYIVSRISTRHNMNRKVGLIAPFWPKSVHVINAGSFLEMAYPNTYSNISRKLCVAMNSPKVIRHTLTLLFAIIFEGDITWGKVVSMFAVAGLFGEESVSQGRADFVKVVIETVVNFIESRLLHWLLLQGGWEAFPVPESNERNRLSKLRLLLLTCATSAILGSSLKLLGLL